MQKVKFKCEIITPMFLNTMDKSPEIRPPSIKGMLRYWFRAINPDLSLYELKQKEAMWFGSSDENGGKSKVSIKVVNPENIKIEAKKPLPHKNNNFVSQSIVSLCKDNKQVEILFLSNDKRILKKTADLFKLSAILGGLGQRSRRGFGSFYITSVEAEEDLFYNKDSYIEFNNNDELYSAIIELTKNIGRDGFYDLSDDLKKITIQNKIKLRKDSKEYPYIEEIQVSEESKAQADLWTTTIGNASHNNKSEYLGHVNGKERLSSPIYVTVVKIKNEYYSLITTLNLAVKSLLRGDDNRDKFKGEILGNKP